MKKDEMLIIPSNSDTTTTTSEPESLLGAEETSLAAPQGDSLIQLSVAQPTLIHREPTAALVQQATDSANAALAVIKNADPSAWPAIGEVIIEPTVIILPGAPRIRICPRNGE